jgi:hypothetical protein
VTTVQTADLTLAEIVFDRLAAASVDDLAGQFVLAAVDGTAQPDHEA